MFDWLRGGNDRELAKKYQGRESASDRKTRKDIERAGRDSARTSARKGQAWEDGEWRRLGGY
ncbi:hypothetical protein ACFV3E_24660 [Streptomyces sp. NPDC059718]